MAPSLFFHRFMYPVALISLALSLNFVGASLARGADASSDSIWIEGENTSSIEPASIKPTLMPGPANVLSGGKWLQLSIDPANVDAAVPATGVVLSYAVNAVTAGDYEVWTHIGYEQIRSPFDWRIDQGPWQTVQNTAYTVDVQEIGIWAPVAWLDLGKQTLTAGNHTLQIRVNKTKDKDGKTAQFITAYDCFLLTSKPFHPDGINKPGDTSWMTDADKAAAAQTFEVPSGTTSQTSISLAGSWQYTGDDEVQVDDRLGPTKSIPNPDGFNWHAMAVPGDRNALLPADAYVHRYYLRTRVKVPADLADHSFILHVPAENLVATVFVNGQQCGSTKLNFAVWDCDVTRAIKPGQVNEIWVAFKDAFYGFSDDKDVKHPQYIPYSFWGQGVTFNLDVPVSGRYETGFPTTSPELIVAGKAYTSDVFAKPSVQNKTLALEITVHNPTGAPITGQLTNEVVPLAGGAAEKTFASKDVSIPAGQDAVVEISEPWANPKLWWPDDPQQYNVVTHLSVGGKEIDQRTTKFGFREWTWDGNNFKINGIPFHGFADTELPPVKDLKSHGETMLRVWAPDSKTEALLDECDADGMPVRRTGIFDGEGANYRLTTPGLWDNYRQELMAWAKGQRNHPSIFIWSMENEITFINGHVFGQDNITTPEMKKAADMLMQLDPTRPVMTDGGNANLDESLPVYGGHYMEPPFNTFPEGCYDRAGFAHRQVWPITKAKPVLLGEAAFIAGDPLADLATVGGEQTFLGQGEARPGIALILRMLSEGYRWNDVSFTFWTDGQIPTYYKAWSPVAILSRQWNWSFGSGEQVKRTFGIFNDSRSTDPITFNWNLVLNGQKAGDGSSNHTVAPGMNEKFDMTLPMPEVAAREEGVLTLTLVQGGKTVFEDTKDVSVLPPTAVTLKTMGRPEAGHIALFDPKGDVKDFLSGLNIPFTLLPDLKQIPVRTKVLIIGNDALDPTTATSSQLSGWASTGNGHALIVLEQENPLKFQGLPGEMTTDTNHGCMGFEEDSTHPALAGLQNKDFSTWGPDSYLYQNAYVKPVSGGKSLVQCDMDLADSALVEMQAGKGTMLLSQLLVGQKIKTSAVAQRLLLNLLAYGDSYRQTFLDTSIVAADNPFLLKAIDTTGLKYTQAADPLAALGKPGSIVIINATPANLKTLAGNLPKVQAFTKGGGWIILNNLTPDGLADFNRLVGVNHIIRPFRKEKVTWPGIRNPLTAGLSGGNVVLGSGQQIFSFKAGEYPDPDGYSYVVDLDDIAPFGISTFPTWNNAVNGYTQADGAWQLIENLPTDKLVVPITLPQPEKILQFTWVSDTNYAGTTKIQLTINGKDYVFDTKPNGDPQTFDIPDQPTTTQLTLKALDWQHDPKFKQADGSVNIGIDNIYIKVARPADFYTKVKPMLNIGAMVEYPNGKGGIILFNVKYQASEQNPANVGKKQAIIAAILHNLKAAFSGGKTIIAGGNLTFKPIDISKQANQFRGDQGWFGDKAHSFAALPSGKQTMAGVDFDIYHFSTSVVPEAIMLGGSGIPGNLPDSVKGIPVNLKADALFFLQAARIDAPRNPDEIKNGKKYEMADYIVHYADGKTETVPIYEEIGVANYMQPTPTAIPGAQIAWSSPYDAAKTSYAVAYSMQWNNPHPDVAISSIDLVYGPDRRGIPALLAVTAAQAQ
jgi:hypothetical protein